MHARANGLAESIGVNKAKCVWETGVTSVCVEAMGGGAAAARAESWAGHSAIDGPKCWHPKVLSAH